MCFCSYTYSLGFSHRFKASFSQSNGSFKDENYNFLFCYIPGLDTELCSAKVCMSEW